MYLSMTLWAEYNRYGYLDEFGVKELPSLDLI